MRNRLRSRYVIDTIFAVSLATLALVDLEQLATSLAPVADELGIRPADGWAVILNLTLTLPLIWRRRFPATVLLVVFSSFVIDRLADYPPTLGLFALAFAFHAVGSDLPKERSVRIGVAGIVAATLFTTLGAFDAEVQDVTWTEVVSLAAITAFPWVLGREIHASRSARSDAEIRAREAEASRAAATRRAVRDERSRIARELHDVVAHQLTVMTVQAGAAKRQLGRDDEKASDALEAIELSGRQGLSEMRRLLDLLRPAETDASLEPQPGLARVDDLIAQMREAGVDVDVVVEGEPRALPAGIELNAYRIIQESLTNTLKHGGSDVHATVTLAFDDDALVVEVVDTGRGAASRLEQRGGESGHGLVGMRERVALLEGTLVAGPRRGGGFRVSAYLPTQTP